MLLKIVRAFAHRSNETFWKVFSAHVTQLAEANELSFDEYVEVLDVFDYSNGEALFGKFVQKFFIDEQFRFQDDFTKVL